MHNDQQEVWADIWMARRGQRYIGWVKGHRGAKVWLGEGNCELEENEQARGICSASYESPVEGRGVPNLGVVNGMWMGWSPGAVCYRTDSDSDARAMWMGWESLDMAWAIGHAHG